MRAFVRGWFVLSFLGGTAWLYAQAPPEKAQDPKPSAAKANEPAKTEVKEPPPSLAIKIADEPRGIDPATLLPKQLSARATHRFEDQTLREVADWLQKELKLDVQLDAKALEEASLDQYDPLTEELADEPIYFLLNRLRTRSLDWYLDEGIVRLTTKTAQENHEYTVSYLLGELLDAGYPSGDELVRVLETTLSPQSWKANGGGGNAILLGDVLFIRQTNEVHLQIAGLLAALKKHGRRTFILDPPENQKLRELLEQPVSLKINNMPFNKAIVELSKSLKTKIHLDRRAFEEAAFDERTPASIVGHNLKLRQLLRVNLDNYGLTALVRDGALAITTKTAAENELRTAVYDVRDLCRDEAESDALMSTIQEQADPTAWKANGGQGDLIMAKTGVLVVCQREEVQDEVLRLLENYRTALRNSKPRPAPVKNTKPVKIFYRIPQAMAKELLAYIPAEVQPKTWRAVDPNAPGTIAMLSSVEEMRDPQGTIVTDETKSEAKNLLLIPQAVLIINQSPDVHEEIERLIAKIRQGTSLQQPEIPSAGGLGGLGGGFGGGGPGAFGGSGGNNNNAFGQGFFSVPSKASPSK